MIGHKAINIGVTDEDIADLTDGEMITTQLDDGTVVAIHLHEDMEGVDDA